MDQTFITIHDLSPDANTLFASESITDILGYHPWEVQNRSCFDYFHPEEVSFARFVHSRCVLLDKAAVLHYARLRSNDGGWVTCECCFTIVYDVLVASTGVYCRGEKSERRAIEAPRISRTFSCSSDDPRHQFLEYLSFKMGGRGVLQVEREPRAALILNRFTRSLEIMFATNAVSSILGLTPDKVQGKSFYEFIQESCLENAVSRLENAKAKDSIAYMRFWSKNPRQQEEPEEGRWGGEDTEDIDDECERECDEDCFWQQENSSQGNCKAGDSCGDHWVEPSDDAYLCGINRYNGCRHRDYFTGKVDQNLSVTDVVDAPAIGVSEMMESSSVRPSLSRIYTGPGQQKKSLVPSVELEAVVSCTSDGLVVVLRRARLQIQTPHHQIYPFNHEGVMIDGFGEQGRVRPCGSQDSSSIQQRSGSPQFLSRYPGNTSFDQLMRSIRGVAVFAQALVKINGSVAYVPSQEPYFNNLHAGPGQGSHSDQPLSEVLAVHEGNGNASECVTFRTTDFPTGGSMHGHLAPSGNEEEASTP